MSYCQTETSYLIPWSSLWQIFSIHEMEFLSIFFITRYTVIDCVLKVYNRLRQKSLDLCEHSPDLISWAAYWFLTLGILFWTIHIFLIGAYIVCLSAAHQRNLCQEEKKKGFSTTCRDWISMLQICYETIYSPFFYTWLMNIQFKYSKDESDKNVKLNIFP